MATRSKRLTVLSEAEQFALYGLPDFDDSQRMQYLGSFTEEELELALSRPGVQAQTYCALQVAYFKAKKAFFQFSWDDVEDDRAFVVSRIFNSQAFIPQAIAKHELWNCFKITLTFHEHVLLLQHGHITSMLAQLCRNRLPAFG